MSVSLRTWLGERLLPSRHTTYFEVRDALAKEGCPICRLVARATDWYLDMLSYEMVNDDGVRAELRAARGFCYRHAWQFTRQIRNGAGRAMLYRDVLEPLLDALSGATAAGSGVLAERLRPRGDCPSCRSQARATHRYLETLVLYLREADFSRRYLASAGLCLPHLDLALRVAHRPAQVDPLLEAAARWAASRRVASRAGLRGETAAIVAGVAGREGAILPRPASADGAEPGTPMPVRAHVALAPDGDGCPVCRAAVQAGEACLVDLPSGVQAHGPAAGPPIALDLCHGHAWRALALLPPGPAARLWQPAAQALRSRLAQAASQSAGPAPQLRLAGSACPACTAQAEVERLAILDLIAGQNRLSLCLPHLALGLRLSREAEQRQALVASQRETLRVLHADLGEYIRKQDYRCHEPRGDEADAPWRVIAHVAGAEGLGAGPLGWGPAGVLSCTSARS